MHKNIIITLCVLSGFCLKAQVNLDSLYTVWQDQTQSDSIRAKAYSDYIWDGFLFSQPDTAFILAEELVSFGLDNNYLRAQYAGYSIQGVSWVNRSDYPKTLYYYIRALNIAKQMGHPAGIAIALNNVGSIYHNQADYPKALDYYIQSLKVNEQMRTAITLSNIGVIYMNQGNYPKALDYNMRSLEINEQKGDQYEVANALSNIGGIYMNQDDYPKSLDYYTQSLKIYEQIDHQIGIAKSYGNIGLIYYKQGEYPKALNYYKKTLEIYKQIGEKNGIASSLTNIGVIYQNQGDYAKALNFCQKSYEISLSIRSLFRQKGSCSCLYDTHKAMGNGNKALNYLELLTAVEDSLHTQETTKKLQQMEFQKVILQDSIAKVAEARFIQEAHEEDIHQEEKTRNISLAVGAFFLLLSGSFYIRWRYVRKSKASLQIEKDRSENLLLNILPKEIAQELKETGKAAPKKYESVTILFTDFKDFTKLVASIPATTLVVELNDIFSQFDDIMDEFGIEKIETIGDAYMAASGLPRENSDHALRCVKAAFRMVEFLEQRNENSEINWNMRTGIHSGPVIAGVVGKKKFAYDLFGDSVNTASRMESNGHVGKVNISQATYELLKNDPDFAFENRGKIEAKGKGEIEMYFVTKK
jgi:class 3 adenylate cyclase/Tfp pilus assembly protein PilF